MAQEQKFLNNCFFKEGKYGFKIALDPEALKNLKLVNGKYRIEAKKSRNGDKWYMVEDTWQPDGGYKTRAVNHSNPPGGDLEMMSGRASDVDDLPF